MKQIPDVLTGSEIIVTRNDATLTGSLGNGVILAGSHQLNNINRKSYEMLQLIGNLLVSCKENPKFRSSQHPYRHTHLGFLI